ncbi:hypothetical protein BJ878DRAFT_232552 [Calycina marina]|uniref:Mitochondrial import inner membrane translocase subunit TIM50 n=1 Tax=Calycina marina TaxID=1763456 RepID=A0A9P7Z7H0_9HELO|nr:hypothetical protein BJ878DRAFT_232552 [Calycina marina]
MLTRAVIRTLQSPTLRTSQWIASSSTVWNRSMAQNNRPNNNSSKKRPLEPYPIPQQGGAYKIDKSADGLSKGAIPRRNNVPGFMNNQGRPISQTESAATADAVESGKVKSQDGLSEDATHGRNNVPGSTDNKKKPISRTDSAATAEPASTEPIVTQQSSKPLPDLTKGIPSTLEYEMAGSPPLSAVNLTEAEESPEGGGRGKGELPASAYISSSDKKRARAANIMYAAFAGTSILGVIYLGRNWDDEEEERKHAAEAPSGWSPVLMWNRAKARLGDQLSYYNEPAFPKLLPNEDPMFSRPYTLVLSMEDLLLHSEWTREHGWRMAKRPGVDYFLRYLSQYYELCLFTSQPWAMAEPIVRKFDPYRIIAWPLYREATSYEKGEYIKDLSYLNRPLSRVIIFDTNPAHTSKQPENAIILPKWKGEVGDKELVSHIPFLEFLATMEVKDVRTALETFKGTHIPTEFARREAIQRKKFEAQMAEEAQKKSKKGKGIGFLSGALGMQAPPMDSEQSISEGMAQGKMLQDVNRERAIKAYMALDQEIRENGEKWLKEEKENEEKMKEESMKMMKSGFTGWFGGSK